MACEAGEDEAGQRSYYSPIGCHEGKKYFGRRAVFGIWRSRKLMNSISLEWFKEFERGTMCGMNDC